MMSMFWSKVQHSKKKNNLYYSRINPLFLHFCLGPLPLASPIDPWTTRTICLADRAFGLFVLYILPSNPFPLSSLAVHSGHATIYIYNTVVCVCSQFIGRVSRRCTPRSMAVWRAGWPVAVDTRSLACGSSTKRGRLLKKKPGELIAAALSKDQIAWMSRILDLRVSAHGGPSETTASRRSTFSSQEER